MEEVRLSPQAIVNEINAVRRNPQAYASCMQELEQCYDGNLRMSLDKLQPGIETLEGVKALHDCLQDLHSSESLPAVKLSPAMSRACERHLADLQRSGLCSHVGSDGSTPEARLACDGEHGDQCSENVAFGPFQSARDVVWHMLLDDGTPERNHRMNLLNGDFGFVGVAHGRHDSIGMAAVLLLTNSFKPKQISEGERRQSVVEQMHHGKLPTSPSATLQETAQKGWDGLLQDNKPKHLQVPGSRRNHVEFNARPQLYKPDRTRVARFVLGDLRRKPDANPTVVQAFVHRLDLNHDEFLVEQDFYRLGIRPDEAAELFDEIVQRRLASDQHRRLVDWSEVFAAVQPKKLWVPVVDIHVDGAAGMHELVVESESMIRWSKEVYQEFGNKCEGLIPPRSGGLHTKEMNSFLASVLTAVVSSTSLPLHQEACVQRLLAPPGCGNTESVNGYIKSALCMNQRRLWAYRVRPNRLAWLRIFRQLDLDPLLPLTGAFAERRLNVSMRRRGIAGTGKGEAAQSPSRSRATVPHTTMVVRDPRPRVQIGKGDNSTVNVAMLTSVTSGDDYPFASSTASGKGQSRPTSATPGADRTMVPPEAPGAAHIASPPPWEQKRQQLETTINRYNGVNASNQQTCTFAAQDKLRQLHVKQQRTSNEMQSPLQELHGGSAARRKQGSAPPDFGSRTAGSHSLLATGGVRSHFHSTDSIQRANNWTQPLNMRWEGVHIDHTELPPHNADAKFSTMSPEQRRRHFGTYFGPSVPDRHAAKLKAASESVRDQDPYTKWREHEFRLDAPVRKGKFGRHHFDLHEREKQPESKRHFMSEVHDAPLADLDRQQERARELADRSIPPRQQTQFQQYLPTSERPLKHIDMATGKAVHFAHGSHRRTGRDGQLHESGANTMNLHARPLGTSQMDQMIPLA